LDEELEVMIDATLPQSGMLKMVSITDVSEIQTPEGYVCVLLEKSEEYNLNEN
jgi:hypothetical protein